MREPWVAEVNRRISGLDGTLGPNIAMTQGEGHGIVAAEANYTHTVSEDDRKIAQQLGEILAPNGPKFSRDETPTIRHGETIQ
jgi:hypothetical protein